MDLREIQDWIIRPQLQRVQGVAEVNSIGGYNKTYVVSPDLTRLQQLQIPLTDLQDALQNNNENRGAGFIEENGQQLTVRVPGMLTSIQDIQNVTVATKTVYPYGLQMLHQYRLVMICVRVVLPIMDRKLFWVSP